MNKKPKNKGSVSAAVSDKPKRSVKQSENNKIKNNTVRLDDINWDPDLLYKENKYYINVSKKFRVAKFATVIIALVFSITMLTFFSTDISAENFQYFLKDFDMIGFSSSGDYSSMVYTGGSASRFAVFRDDLVIINSGSTLLYNSNGSLVLNKSNKFYSPKVEASKKYLLAYDSGNTTCSYAIYNSFSELKSDKFEYPITAAAISDSGSYILVTHDDNTKGIAYIYDSNFNIKNEIKIDRYILSADITDDGKNVVIASVYDSNGHFNTELMILKVGSDNAEAVINVSSRAPMKVKYLDNGNFAVLYTDSITVYNSKLQVVQDIYIGDMQKPTVEIGDFGFAIVFNKTVIGEEKTLNAYNADGKMMCTAEYRGELVDLSINGEKVYLLFENEICMLNTSDGQKYTEAAEPNAIDVVFTSNGLPIICYAGKALPITFN